MKGKFKKLLAVMCALALAISSGAAAAVSAEETVDYSEYYTLIIDRWEETIIGSGELDMTDEVIAEKVNTITEEAQGYWETMTRPDTENPTKEDYFELWLSNTAVFSTSTTNGVGLSGHIWADKAASPILQSSSDSARAQTAAFTNNFNRIRAMAVAYRIGNEALKGNEEFLKETMYALEFLCTYWYAETTTEYGNWWDWNVGIPLALNDTAVLLRDYADIDLLKECVSHINYFTPHTMLGANLNWRSCIKAIMGAFLEDYTYLETAKSGFEKVLTYVTSSDGFYEADGSFIQHSYFAYMGNYGANLYKILSRSLVALKDTPWDISDEKKQMALDTIKASVEPLLVDGRIMELACGRSVASGTGLSSYSGGAAIINTIPIFAEMAEGEQAEYLKSLSKEMLTYLTSEEVLAVYDYYGNTDLGVYLYAKAILEDNTIAPFTRTDNARVFYNMDRVVKHTENYSLGLAIHSTRTGAYEQANGNNTKGWWQASGALFVYNGDAAKYVDHFWYTSDWFRLAGTTSLYGKTITAETGSGTSCGRNSWSGGTELGDYAIASTLLQPVNLTLEAKKSYFMFDNEVVALGSGISAEEDASIETTVENIKLLNDNSNVFKVDGVETEIDADGDGKIDTATSGDTSTKNSNSVTTEIENYAYLSGNTEDSSMGYYFPEGATLKIAREARTGNSYMVNPGSSTDDKTNYTRNYLTMYYDHGVNAENSDSYSYVLLPSATEEETAAYSENSDVEILANNDSVQAVYENNLKMTGVTFWNNSETTVYKNGEEWITSNGACSLMVKEEGESLTVSVSDPTQENTEKFYIEINIGDKSAIIDTENSNSDITVISANGKLILEVDPNSAAGYKGESKTAVFTLSDETVETEYAEPSISNTVFFATEGTDAYYELGFTGTLPAEFKLSVAEGEDESILDYVTTDRFGKIYVWSGLDLGQYNLTLAVTNTDNDGNESSKSYDITVTVLTSVEAKSPSGSVVYYTFNEGYGTYVGTDTKIKSSSSQDFSGELSESAEWVEGFVGTAVKFDSIEDTLINDGATGTNADSIGMQPTQSVFGGATEYDFWVKFDEDPTTRDADQWIISKGSKEASTSIPWAIKVTTAGKIAFIWNKAAATSSNWVYSSELSWNEGEWYHITVTQDSSYAVTIERDGITVGTGMSGTGVTAINRVTSINSGNYLAANTAQYFNGTIDELYLGAAGGGEEIRLRSKVSFDTGDGGSAVSPQYPYLNETVTQPENPTNADYAFLGWYTDEEYTTMYDFSTPVTTDITLYAKWGRIPEVSVTNRIIYYNFNEGSGTTVNVSGTKLSSVTSKMDMNATISDGVKWTEGFVGFGLNFDSLSDSLAMNTASGTNANAIGMKPTESVFSGGTEYDFWVKFDVDPSESEQMLLARQHTGTTITWNIKVTANGEIGFAYGSNNFVLSKALDWNAGEWYHINITHTSAFLATISRDGIVVGSGTTGTTCVGSSQTMRINSGNYFTSSNYFRGTIDELFLGSMGYAQNAYSRHKVSFISDGAEIEPQYVWSGETATEPTVDIDNYMVVGWYTDEEYTTEYDFSSAVTSDITLYAKLEEEKEIIYGDANGDGEVSAEDMSMLRQYLLGTLTAEIADITVLDVNADTYINIKDLVHFKKYFAQIISYLGPQK